LSSSLRAQSDLGLLMAGKGPAECMALVAAAPGLPAFIVAALCRLAELCARLPWRTRPRLTDWGLWHAAVPSGRAVVSSGVRARAPERETVQARPRARLLPPAVSRAHQHVSTCAQQGTACVMQCGAPRAGVAPPGGQAAGGRVAGQGGEGNASFVWSQHTDHYVSRSLVGAARMGQCRALAVSLVRAGALGAAVRLTQRYVGAHAASERERVAATALHSLTGTLFILGRHVPEVSANAGSALQGTGSCVLSRVLETSVPARYSSGARICLSYLWS